MHFREGSSSVRFFIPHFFVFCLILASLGHAWYACDGTDRSQRRLTWMMHDERSRINAVSSFAIATFNNNCSILHHLRRDLYPKTLSGLSTCLFLGLHPLGGPSESTRCFLAKRGSWNRRGGASVAGQRKTSERPRVDTSPSIPSLCISVRTYREAIQPQIHPSVRQRFCVDTGGLWSPSWTYGWSGDGGQIVSWSAPPAESLVSCAVLSRVRD